MNYINAKTREITSHRLLCRTANASIPMGRDFGDWQPFRSAPLPQLEEGKTAVPGGIVEIDGRLYQGWEVVDAVQPAE